MDGVWCDIFKNEIMIGKYKVEFGKNQIKVGCKFVTKQQIEVVKEMIELNDVETGYSYITICKHDITLDLIKRILLGFENQ